MKEEASLLFSSYIIDGVQMEQTPFSALYDCLDGNGTVDIPDVAFDDIVDEYMDKAPHSFSYDPSLVGEYVQKILRTPRRRMDVNYPVSSTRSAINEVLLDCLFRDGHFTLQDLLLIARWDWNGAPAGNAAAFYDSALTAGGYLFDLGVRLDRYFVEKSRRDCSLEIVLRAVSSEKKGGRILSRRACPDTMAPSPRDWLVYVPFDSAKMNLGGSALSAVVGEGSGAELDQQDPDYFIDCYEVLRELVEDRVIVAGRPVGYGGLATAAHLFKGRRGFMMDIAGIMEGAAEPDMVKTLFCEIPGVLVQIKDSDYDYFDSQMVLQDVAYYPLGHPAPDMDQIRICRNFKDGISAILRSLMDNASEGED